MTINRIPPNKIREEEAEKASYSYLMSTVVLIVGLPMPIINMLATLMFYLGNRKKTYFVRFHCLQSLLSQILIICMNFVGVSWTLSILFGYGEFSNRNEFNNYYFGYIFTILLFNLLEFIASIYAASQTRKKKDVRFWIFGQLTELICKPDPEEGTISQRF